MDSDANEIFPKSRTIPRIGVLLILMNFSLLSSVSSKLSLRIACELTGPVEEEYGTKSQSVYSNSAELHRYIGQRANWYQDPTTVP
jgi:hypothetical protein